jgi:single-strand DNA-binding protein
MSFIKICRLGRDAEVRYVPSGEAVATLSLAYNYGKKDQDGKRKTQWLDAGFWGDRAVKMQHLLLRGVRVQVTASELHIEEFRKGDGSPGYKLACRVNDIEIIDYVDDQQQGGQQAQAPAQRQAAPAPRPAPPPRPASGFDDMDSDIPF